MTILPCHLFSNKGGETIAYLNLKLDQSTTNLTMKNGPKGQQLSISYYEKCDDKNVEPRPIYKIVSIIPNKNLWSQINTNCTFKHVEEIMPGNGNRYGTVAISFLTYPSGTDVEILNG